MDWIDVSIPLREDMTVFTGEPPFHRERISAIADGAICNISQMALGVHTGTHVDAPIHFVEGGETAEAIALDALIGPAWVVDATAATGRSRPPTSTASTSRRTRFGCSSGRGLRTCGTRQASSRASSRSTQRQRRRSSDAACGRSGSITCRSRRSATRSPRTGSCSRPASSCSRGWTCGTSAPGPVRPAVPATPDRRQRRRAGPRAPPTAGLSGSNRERPDPPGARGHRTVSGSPVSMNVLRPDTMYDDAARERLGALRAGPEGARDRQLRAAVLGGLHLPGHPHRAFGLSLRIPARMERHDDTPPRVDLEDLAVGRGRAVGIGVGQRRAGRPVGGDARAEVVADGLVALGDGPPDAVRRRP